MNRHIALITEHLQDMNFLTLVSPSLQVLMKGSPRLLAAGPEALWKVLVFHIRSVQKIRAIHELV